LLADALRRIPGTNAVARRVGRWRFDRHLRKTGVREYFDPRLKRRFLAGERFSLDELEAKYDRVWERFVDDCVTGDDLAAIIEHLHPESRTCIDVGCGVGRVAVEVARTGRKVTGVDLSGAALERAAVLAEQAGVEIDLVKAPVERLPFPDGAFDAVLCSHTLEHVQDLEAAVSELMRVAARQLIVIVPREDTLSEESTDYHFQVFPDAAALEAAIPLPEHVCFVENEQWQGEYVFFAGNLH
jgi:ubiquinone/menaquinone biosynthesis C-methylase UbiE